jgi:hypothetical protein
MRQLKNKTTEAKEKATSKCFTYQHMQIYEGTFHFRSDYAMPLLLLKAGLLRRYN